MSTHMARWETETPDEPYSVYLANRPAAAQPACVVDHAKVAPSACPRCGADPMQPAPEAEDRDVLARLLFEARGAVDWNGSSEPIRDVWRRVADVAQMWCLR